MATPAEERRLRQGTRTKARKAALDILFEAEIRSGRLAEHLTAWTERATPPVRDFTTLLVEGVDAHRAEIDDVLASALSEGWTISRMPRVDRQACRIAIFELTRTDTAPEVAVAEAVKLVADLSTDDSPGFVNAVLRRVAGERVDQHRALADIVAPEDLSDGSTDDLD